MQCYGCGKKGHYLRKCPSTWAKMGKDILAMGKSGDFKATKTGGVNTAVEGKGEEPDKPPEDADVEHFMDFYRQNQF